MTCDFFPNHGIGLKIQGEQAMGGNRQPAIAGLVESGLAPPIPLFYVLQEMETHEYGNLSSEGIEIVRRDGRLFVRYDAGAHFAKWREDEITEEEFGGIMRDGGGSNRTLLQIQTRLENAGIDPYNSNWSPI